MNRGRIILSVLFFLVLETGVVIYSILPVFDRISARPDVEIRIGIIPELSKGRASVDWEPFFNHLQGQFKFTVHPYYANSFEEAVCGFLNGSLDLLYIDPLSYVRIQQETGAKAILYHRLSKREHGLNRAVIVAGRDIKYLPESKGKAIAFSEKNSMSGFIIPDRFLKTKVNVPLENWFSSVTFAGSSGDAAEMLVTGKTDVIAGNWLEISDFFANLNLKEEEIRVLWMSKILPENLICLSPSSPYASERTYWDDMSKFFEDEMPDSSFNRKSMYFSPVDLPYKQSLDHIEKFMDERKTYSADTMFISN